MAKLLYLAYTWLDDKEIEVVSSFNDTNDICIRSKNKFIKVLSGTFKYGVDIDTPIETLWFIKKSSG